MKALSCFYIVGSVFTVASISLYFAYLKKLEEKQEVVLKKVRESFRGGFSGQALRNGGGGTGGGSDANYASVSPLETFCSSDADCGGSKRCGTTGFCV
jgi:hypothetical protein